ncbi:MAG: hypothetical protein E3J56_01075 [Candidatus Aminicenantes bacterium]|nr:MAG: hypothetical protein E3J56_01075 [Candidatus Aminicenantes bacterium]
MTTERRHLAINDAIDALIAAIGDILAAGKLIAPIEILDAAGGNVIAKIDTSGNLYIKGRLLKIT